jgi:hypothetical protein
LLAAHAAELKIPLAIDNPTSAFQGTPKPIKNIANLEPRQESAREFLVPPRTKLLSRGKRVTSSDALPVIGELPYLNDGDKTGIDGTVLELGPGPQWVQLDLGSAAEVRVVAVWHFHSELRVYHDVVVQISDDPTFTKNVTTVYNSDDDNSSKLGRGRDRSYIETRLGRIIDAKGVVGRYVRLHSNGNTSDELNHYAEVEVYGLPVGASGPQAAALAGGHRRE